MIRRTTAVLFLLAVSAPLSAQEAGIGAPCARSEVPPQARETCFTVAQAVESAQPQLGMLLAAGNPTLGTASAGGVRLVALPRVSISGKANLVFVRIPDILAEEGGSAVQQLNESIGLPVPALAGTATLGIFPGVSIAPTIGGVGALDVLGSATWLPFSAFDIEGFGDELASVSYGVGGRLGLLRESFTTPGISVSLMYRSLGDLEYGDVCSSPALGATDTSQGYALTVGACTDQGDPGEFSFNLTNWSTRAVISKRLLGLGLTAGAGYDTFASDVDFGFSSECPVIGGPCFVRANGLSIDSDRLSAFGNLSFTALVATLALEAGWMEGDEAIAGFDAATSDFDPARGTFFGSLGIRLSF